MSMADLNITNKNKRKQVKYSLRSLILWKTSKYEQRIKTRRNKPHGQHAPSSPYIYILSISFSKTSQPLLLPNEKDFT